MKAHFSEPSPAPVKAVLALMGRIEERLRLPMVPVTAATRQKLEAMLASWNCCPPLQSKQDEDGQVGSAN